MSGAHYIKLINVMYRILGTKKRPRAAVMSAPLKPPYPSPPLLYSMLGFTSQTFGYGVRLVSSASPRAVPRVNLRIGRSLRLQYLAVDLCSFPWLFLALSAWFREYPLLPARVFNHGVKPVAFVTRYALSLAILGQAVIDYKPLCRLRLMLPLR